MEDLKMLMQAHLSKNTENFCLFYFNKKDSVYHFHA